MNIKYKIKLIFNILIVILSLSCISLSPAYAIKIGLLTNAQHAYVATSKYGSLIDGYTGKRVASISPMQVYMVRSTGSYLAIVSNNRTIKVSSKYLVLVTQKDGFVYAKNKWYRDKLVIYNVGSGVTIINELGIEKYLMGVVPAEMPRSWNIEAHKAQAIAARSYAIANLGKRARYGYDLKDTPEDQAYGGASSECAKTDKAVEETRSQVLVYRNKVIPAYYHSSSGGYTVNSGAIWFKDLPFLRSVPSFDGNIPRSGHGIGMSQHGANVLANYGYNAYQILGYFYQNVQLYKINNVL